MNLATLIVLFKNSSSSIPTLISNRFHVHRFPAITLPISQNNLVKFLGKYLNTLILNSMHTPYHQFSYHNLPPIL